MHRHSHHPPGHAHGSGHRYERHMRKPHGWGGHGSGPGIGRGHRGGRIGRFLEHGDLRFVILALLEDQSRHGYELIKELETRTGGVYRPSPGVIYPTLALLEDEGLAAPAGGEGRKAFEITDAGRETLAAHRPGVEAVFQRMAAAAEGSETTRPRIARAMANLGMALEQRLRPPVSEADLDAIVRLIDDTAAAIEKIKR
jgi:DNA-binding PadR family transcriptional regulator